MSFFSHFSCILGIYLEKNACTILICRFLAYSLQPSAISNPSGWKTLPFWDIRGLQASYLDQGTQILPLALCWFIFQDTVSPLQMNPQHVDNGCQVRHSIGVRWKGIVTSSYFICHHLWQTTSPRSIGQLLGYFLQ